MLRVGSGEGTGAVKTTHVYTGWTARYRGHGAFILRTESLASPYPFHALLEQALFLVISVTDIIRQ